MPNVQQMLYLSDPQKLEFETSVVESWRMPDGRWAARLARSYFYPTGGGQEHDTGWVGARRVVEVVKQEDNGEIVHIFDQEPPVGSAIARIDGERRLRHMQHHTAQHLLSQVFIQLFELETLSANINGYTPSTIDLPTAGLAPEQLVEAEGLANQLIFEDHPVRAAFVTPDELALLPLRKAPKVSENIRIVEIEGLDFSPCGGTHCQSTGQIGVLKILKTEKVNERTRVHFAAGWQALEVFRQAYQAVSSLAGEMSIHHQDLQAAVERQGEQLRQAQKELGELRQERLAWEAQRLLQDAETIGGRQVVLAVFDLRPAQELRWLADSLRRQPRAAAVLASHDGEKLLLAAACGAESGLSARELLSELLTPLNGRGGGDSSLAQGGGSASVERVQELMDQARELLGRS